MKTAVILGAGGLGCPAALALRDEARARDLSLRIVLVDPDRVDRSNLSRQFLYDDRDVGLFKSEVAARKLSVGSRVARFDAANAASILERADILLDGTDDAATRFLANDEAVARRIPLIHGAVLGWTGQLLAVVPGRTACLRCLFERPPEAGPTCAEAGVLSPLCGVVGATMARAAVQALDEKKIIFSSLPPPEPGVLLRWDAFRGSQRPLLVKRDPSCAACARVAS